LNIFGGVPGFRRLVVGAPSSLLLQSFSKIGNTWNCSLREFHTNSTSSSDESEKWYQLSSTVLTTISECGTKASIELLDGNELKPKFSGWDDSPNAQVLLKEILLSHETMMKKEEEYEKMLHGNLDPDDNEVNNVKHLGHGVLMQNFTKSILDDSSDSIPSVITRRETRNVSRAVLSRFFETLNEEKKHAAVVGNP
jgi:hypothetical protein